MREPIINEDTFGVYNNFRHVASLNDRKLFTYQFAYFRTDRNTCQNTLKSKELPVICLRPSLLENDQNTMLLTPQWQKYTFLLVGLTITLILWVVAVKLGKIKNGN